MLPTALTLPLLCSLFWLSRSSPPVNFQVTQPPVVPLSAKQCTVLVLQRDFAFSFGLPEIVQLTPPIDCGPPGSWAAVTLNLTVTSNGTQFDRLGTFTFQNTEIWRTSTSQPLDSHEIIWTYVKDVSQFIPLFSKPGAFIFQLDNLITGELDGIFSTTVHATYHASSDQNPPAKQADLIIPLSSLLNNTGNQAYVPPAFNINVTLPRNAVALYTELMASGSADDEFWYGNTPNEFMPNFPPNSTNGQGPFREIRLLIDGRVAGVVFPYPVIFTGGIAPSLWSPISAYGAHDLPSYFLDVTPFVPLLTDGCSHQFTIDVVSAESDHAIPNNWFVSGTLQVVTDRSSIPTTGEMKVYDVLPYAKSLISGSVQSDEISVTVSSTRKIHIESDIQTGGGESIHVVWTQEYSYQNEQQYYNYKSNTTHQVVKQTTVGKAVGFHNNNLVVVDDFSYPLDVDNVILDDQQSISTSRVAHKYDRTVLPSPLRLQTSINSTQIADGIYELHPSGNFGNGTSYNTFEYLDTLGNTYCRQVNSMGRIIFDDQAGSLAPHDELVTSSENDPTTF